MLEQELIGKQHLEEESQRLKEESRGELSTHPPAFLRVQS